MTQTRILVTGGAGFVGSSLALRLKAETPTATVIAFDNLKRRGSELALPRLAAAGVSFLHGDVRSADDLAEAGGFDLLIDCSAEPSVHAGYGGSPAYVIQTNLGGTIQCLEAARRHAAAVVFLSTSRVYPIAGLRALPLVEAGTRLAIKPGANGTGFSEAGIGPEFPLAGARSIYGATKLASELLVAEYVETYGLKAIVNRCGVLTGPWQMGKVDQGFIVLWAARHLFGGKLGYSGFGGAGLQVRDILHVDDLFALLQIQIAQMNRFSGHTFNVGGGPTVSVSLNELTRLCEAATGQRIAIASDPATRPADVPWYVTDNGAVSAATGWAPRRSAEDIIAEVVAWLKEHRRVLEPILA